MAALLVVAPARGSYTGIPAALVPLIAAKFETVGIHGPEIPGFKSYPADVELPAALAAVAWTHVVVMGTPADLEQYVAAGITSTASSAIVYAYAFIETPFLGRTVAPLATHFDFFVATSNMAAQAYRNVLLDLNGKVPKAVFKGAYETKVIRPGTDTKTFVPMDPFKRDFSRAEIREAIFGDVTDSDFVVVTWAHDTAVTLATIKQLKDRMAPRRVVVALLAKHPWIEARCSGLDLVFGTDVRPLYGIPDAGTRNLVYNAADVYLCADTASGWPGDILEAQAAGCVVAAPDDHIWLELIEGKRGIELPAGLLEIRPEFRRRVLPDAAAERIAKAFSTDLHKEIRDVCLVETHRKGSEWAWTRCASEWLGLMGLQ
jgi:glycosyltransferase involved in cell wall biosynthesis